ncbi:MAG: HipA N-terminal domain-containing protein [Chitinophagaceae bacterium]|nr:HipA N-terminal domain-containing protein [Chitinophagaceae bacterium]
MKAAVYNNEILAGILEKTSSGSYSFTYDDQYLQNSAYPSISLTLPKSEKSFSATNLFPFFYGLLAEGVNKTIQCGLLKIDEKDDFTRLLKTATNETIGAITIKEIEP